MFPFTFRLFSLNSECFHSCFAQLISIANVTFQFSSFRSQQLMFPFMFRLVDLNSEWFLSLFTRIFELNSEYIFHLVEISIVNLSVKFMSIGSKQRIFPFTFRLYDLNRKYFLSLLVQSSRSRQCSVCENNINITFFLVKLIFGFWYRSHARQNISKLLYHPFHKTLPRSSAFVKFISVRFFETGCSYRKTQMFNKIICWSR